MCISLLREGTSKRDIVRYRQNYYEYFIALSDKLPRSGFIAIERA